MPEDFQLTFDRGLATMVLSLLQEDGVRLDKEAIPFNEEFFTGKRITVLTQ
jgi:hypothetical protein